MTFRVVLLPRAELDIEANARWWAANHSVEQAVRWFDASYQAINLLTTFPESHSLSMENNEFPLEIRDKLLGLSSRPSHRAVFTISDNTVYVLTVRGVNQDRLRPEDVELPPFDA